MAEPGGDDERGRDLLQELRRLTAWWQGRDDGDAQGSAADGDGAADGGAPADAGTGGSRLGAGGGVGLVVAAAIACLGAWPTAASAVTKTWLSTPGHWHTPTIWSPGGVPGPDDDVVISVPGFVVSTGDGAANSPCPVSLHFVARCRKVWPVGALAPA